MAAAASAPCSAPPGIANPAVSESLCFETLVPVNATSGVGIRAYGIGGETLVQWSAHATFDATPDAIPSLLAYFEGANAGGRDLRFARTTPILAKGYFAAMGYFILEVAMAVSPSAFPNASTIPQPTSQTLRPLGNHTVAVTQFNTSGFPTEEDFVVACGRLQPWTLPAGYSMAYSANWFPAHAIYSGQDANTTNATFTSECFKQVNGPSSV